ncbi:MAG: DNA polymerase IV [Pseudomonadota bacterium]
MSERQILHVDMDAFYASVEERENPDLVGKPVIVAGAPRGRGVVSAANYVAREYGVRSAMPAAQALRLCPHGVFIPPRHALYAEVSRQIHRIFRYYTPLVEPLALDEAFLDVTASRRLFGPGFEIARRIKGEILQRTQLVASVGIAPNKFLAKLAGDVRKPDALVEVLPGEEQAFLDPLPASRIWGLGRRSVETLERIGVKTIADLRSQPESLLQELFGRTGEHVARLARGVDARPVVAEHEARSLSHETTFSVDLAEPGVMRAWLLELADQVASRARRAGLSGRTATIKVRFASFKTITRSQTFEQPTHSSRALRGAVDVLFKERLNVALEPVRLLGVGLSGFDQAQAVQDDLFGDADAVRDQEIDSVVDRARGRFGRDALRRGLAPRRTE